MKILIQHKFLKYVTVQKDDGNTHIGLFADDLEDAYLQFNASLVLLEEHNDVYPDNNIKAQSLAINLNSYEWKPYKNCV